jgi:hypothetical protein
MIVVNKFFTEGIEARKKDQNRNTNPYKTGIKLTFIQRLFYTKYSKKSYADFAKEMWYEGWDAEDLDQRITLERIRTAEAQHAAQELFAKECLQDHNRLTFLLQHFLKRNGGYLDLQALAVVKLEFGDPKEFDIVKFKHWLDTEMNKQRITNTA